MPARKSTTRRPKGSPKANAAPKRAAPAVSLAAFLAEAAWSEADAALAQALADFDEAGTASDKAAREDAWARLGQSLARAGRKRGLARIGELEAHEPYDPDRHDLNTRVAKPPKTVLVRARGVARGGDVLERPRVAPVERKRRR
jgi:hypothetical protein